MICPAHGVQPVMVAGICPQCWQEDANRKPIVKIKDSKHGHR